MKKSVIALCAFAMLPVATITAKADEPSWMEGTWRGAGSQSGTGSHWEIVLTVSPNSYAISYPSLGCSGYWTLTQNAPAATGGTASFIEHIQVGRGKCVDNGTITVGSAATSSGKVQTMAYHWSGLQPDGSSDNAGGMLTKDGSGSPPPGPPNGNLQGPNNSAPRHPYAPPRALPGGAP